MQVFRNKLSQYVRLADDAWLPIKELDQRTETFEAGEDLIVAGQDANEIFILQTGWALRYRLLEDGRRQIVNFMLPGDVFDLQSLADLQADHTVTAITDCDVTVIPARPFVRMLRDSTRIAAAFWWAAVQEESILREQIVRIGRRSARERIGHMLLELHRRYAGATGEETDELVMPVTRADIADALGLTPVHVSRTMSAMRRSGLIAEERGSIKLLDRARLARLSHFDTDYLHLKKLNLLTHGLSSNHTAPATALDAD
ncbi:Crp/Fnr family transcriptional regulator [Henriciella pelagia]|jgi:CRP-like cAMP-binding protein|uniref:Crp/Fnr family transcriptional regulator n=1 Tax=Henriciella pelagia TaxID=1977912 RepID=A0ABQ1JA60_9PROT|nr:Crp/Fnr family transcriptional regulator [Henriciella pelagia]GGB62262.1 Crp/Fnr family transcriptional regulator [Henriciella pelagia]